MLLLNNLLRLAYIVIVLNITDSICVKKCFKPQSDIQYNIKIGDVKPPSMFRKASAFPKFSIKASKNNQIKYQLFQGDDVGKYYNQETIKSVKVDKDIPLKIFVHGWISSEKEPWYKLLQKEYFKKGPYNVLYIDWSVPATQTYINSVAITKLIAGYIAQFLITSKIPPTNMHIIAHSLGAHVAGFIGKAIKTGTSQHIGRITGLDPAGPYFKNVGPSSRLSADDALFVDVIHTDGLNYGYLDQIGHVDFYPNGGDQQPGCPTVPDIHATENCNHARSQLLFIESVNSNGFISKSATSWNEYLQGNFTIPIYAILGDSVPHSARGKFYLKTNDKSPFATKKMY